MTMPSCVKHARILGVPADQIARIEEASLLEAAKLFWTFAFEMITPVLTDEQIAEMKRRLFEGKASN